MNVAIMDLNGNSNIGLYMFVNDKFLLLGEEVPESFDETLKKVFEVPIHRISIAGTSLIGVFVAGNNEKIIIPHIVFDEETDVLTKLGIDFEVIETRLTCLGNNLFVSNNAIYANPEYAPEQLKKIAKYFDMKTVKLEFEEIKTVGNLIVINESKMKGLIANDLQDEDIEKLSKQTGLELTPCSVNMGGQYLGAGIVCNKNGFIIGKSSGAAEITTAEEGLGFLDE